jgi:uncharacterized membrane protein YfcA
MLLESFILFISGLLGGVLNSVAGGGSFITFPALLFAGVPPVSANATNTFSSCAGYLSGTYAFRDELSRHKQSLLPIIIISLLGGAAGAWLLLQTPGHLFREAIPWLLLFATLLLVIGEHVNRLLKQLMTHHQQASLVGGFLIFVLLFGVSLYGGFFNAGLGIITLSYLALAGYNDIHVMNGMKLLISSLVSLTAIFLFMYNDVIAWYEGMMVLGGSVVGGYVAARFSKRGSQSLIKTLVVMVSSLMTLYFFILIYAS